MEHINFPTLPCLYFVECHNSKITLLANEKDLSESIFTLPPLAEQKEIAAYLDKKCGDIDALREHNKNIIESLQEYKQSLIYEAVTGKIEL